MKCIYNSAKTKDFRTHNIFLDMHVPLLVFQENTLWHVRRKFRITKGDFITLAAGHMIANEHIMHYFDNQNLMRTIVGISRNVVFKSLRRLQRQGLISPVDLKKKKRRFVVTDKGRDCIKSYTNYFSYTLGMYKVR